MQGIPSNVVSLRPSVAGTSFAQSSTVLSSPDLSSSLLSSSFIDRHQLVWPVTEVVDEEIDFDLKEEVCVFIVVVFC